MLSSCLVSVLCVILSLPCSLSQAQVIDFAWKDVRSYDVDEEGMSFNFEYNRPGRKPRTVKILTNYVSGVSYVSNNIVVICRSAEFLISLYAEVI